MALLLRKAAYFLIDIFSDYSDNSQETLVRKLNLPYSPGRIALWGYSFKASFYSVGNFFFGSTPNGVGKMIGVVSKGISYQYSHNQFLEILVSTGYIGVLLFVIWLFGIAKNSIQIVFFGKNIQIYKRFIPFIVLGCIVSNMFEATLMFQPFFMGNMFIFLCGWISGFSQELQTKQKE